MLKEEKKRIKENEIESTRQEITVKNEKKTQFATMRRYMGVEDIKKRRKKRIK